MPSWNKKLNSEQEETDAVRPAPIAQMQLLCAFIHASLEFV